MGARIWARHKDVVEIDEGKGQVAQYGVHEPLECHSCIPQPERHPGELKEAERRDDRRFGNVFRRHWHLEVPLPKIQLAKQLTAVQATCQIRHVRKGVLVLHRLKI
jgi:hypothetical protein